jgi:hypothetical protein
MILPTRFIRANAQDSALSVAHCHVLWRSGRDSALGESPVRRVEVDQHGHHGGIVEAMWRRTDLPALGRTIGLSGRRTSFRRHREEPGVGVARRAVDELKLVVARVSFAAAKNGGEMTSVARGVLIACATQDRKSAKAASVVWTLVAAGPER